MAIAMAHRAVRRSRRSALSEAGGSANHVHYGVNHIENEIEESLLLSVDG